MSQPTHLKAGQPCPTFSATDQNGSIITNVNLLGNKYILFFYGQDDTPTCTKQVCTANEALPEAQKNGYIVFGVSPDKVNKHLKFISKFQLKINLLSDPDKDMMYAFGAYGPKIFMGKEVVGVYRKAYFINESGMITHIIDEVTAAKQGEQILGILSKST